MCGGEIQQSDGETAGAVGDKAALSRVCLERLSVLVLAPGPRAVVWHWNSLNFVSISVSFGPRLVVQRTYSWCVLGITPGYGG